RCRSKRWWMTVRSTRRFARSSARRGPEKSGTGVCMSRPSCRATRSARANANSRKQGQQAGEGDQEDSARRKDSAVLERPRRTHMSRGARPRLRGHVKGEIAKAIEEQGVSTPLARRVALQIALKCESDEWGDRAVWTAIGQLLAEEAMRLRERSGLSDRQIDT